MSDDNETVEQVALSDLPLAEQLRIIRGNYCIGSGEFDALDEAADVVECHQREIEAKDRQLEAASADAEAADAEIDKLKFDNLHLKSVQRQAEEVIIEQTNKVAAKDAEIENLKKDNARLRVINCGNYYADEQLRDELAAKDAEIVRLRSLVEGLLAASATECADCRYDCGPNRENCIVHEAANYIKKVEVEND